MMKRYTLTFLLLTLAVCVLVAAVNYRVDPYGIFRFKEANARSLSRIDQFFHLRLTKPWLVMQTEPAAVIVGTSRAATVRPVHPSWPSSGSYNLSIPGQTPYEMLRFVEHAQALGPLDKMMIGLDFEAFVSSEPQYRLGFEESRMVRDTAGLSSPKLFLRGILDLRDTLFSINSLKSSLTALTGTAEVSNRYFKDGSWVRATNQLTGQGGYIYLGKEKVQAPSASQVDLEANMKIFADILRFAHKQEIETRLFITPEHIFVIDLLMRVGYGDLWSEFHRRLVAVNDAVAQEMGVEPFPLVGFNQMQGVVDEPIRKGLQANQSLFTDGSHFRPALGREIMMAVWADEGEQGARLDAYSVEGYLSEVEQIRVGFERENAEITATLRRAIAPELE